jgi:hypothetical protein
MPENIKKCYNEFAIVLFILDTNLASGVKA